MTRLIDADELAEIINWTFAKPPFSRKTVQKMIDMARTIDAVPVIRCKDCKYWNPKNKYCEGIGNWFGIVGEWGENGFCYKAERRGEE